MGQEKGWGTLN